MINSARSNPDALFGQEAHFLESLIIAIAAGALALLFAALTSVRVMLQEQGNQRMRDIGDAIREEPPPFCVGNTWP